MDCEVEEQGEGGRKMLEADGAVVEVEAVGDVAEEGEEGGGDDGDADDVDDLVAACQDAYTWL